MRSIKWAVAVVAASSLLGCGSPQPSIYRVAIQVMPVPTSCYRTAPTTSPDTTTNVVDEKQWVIWEGVEDKMYLEPGTINYPMGDAQSVRITNADGIEGGKSDKQTIFTTTRTQTASANEVYTTTATYTFDELGNTLKGTLALHSSCAGSNCGTSPACDVSLTFSGREITGDRNIDFGSTSGG